MAKFRKAILRTGKYHSPDGVVEVTPDRLRHWELQFRRMSDARQVIPIDWDHADDAAKMTPLPREEYAKRRSAASTIGHLADFRVCDSGNAAEITLDLRTPKAVEAASLNTVYVSPVLFPSWKDGSGRTYQDVITHVDMVNHPVDASQSPFVPVEPETIACALRMSLSVTPFRLSTEAEDMDEEDLKDKDEDKADAPEGDSEDSGEDAGEDSGQNLGQPTENGSTLADVVESLKQFNIVLQEGTTAENLLDRLHAALLTAAAHQGKGEDDAGPTGGLEPQVQQPDIATMSLYGQAAYKLAEEQQRKDLARRLEDLAKTGRCTPVEAKERTQAVEAYRLGLDPKTGKPTSTRLEEWIASREAVPKGIFWSTEQRLSLDGGSVVEPPAHMHGEMTTEEIESTVAWALGRKK